MLPWIAVILLPLLFGLYAQTRLMSVYTRTKRLRSMGNITGAEAARAILSTYRIYNVDIVPIKGELTDHYNPTNRQLALSESNYYGTSLAAIGIAAHEAGHAIQHKQGYHFMHLRQSLVPAVQFATPIAWFICSFGIVLLSILGASYLGALMIKIGIAALVIIAFFQLITLPVEFDASRRAQLAVENLGIITNNERQPVQDTLNAAALTYVAAFVATIGNILYLILHLNQSNR